jgi:hypothetical protein
LELCSEKDSDLFSDSESFLGQKSLEGQINIILRPYHESTGDRSTHQKEQFDFWERVKGSNARRIDSIPIQWKGTGTNNGRKFDLWGEEGYPGILSRPNWKQFDRLGWGLL